jgi:hypothetical protein
MGSSSERVKQSKEIVILIVLHDAEDLSLNCRAGVALQTERHIPEDFSPQQHGCVRSLPRCPQKELFKKYGLESGIFHL